MAASTRRAPEQHTMRIHHAHESTSPLLYAHESTSPLLLCYGTLFASRLPRCLQHTPEGATGEHSHMMTCVHIAAKQACGVTET